MRETPKLLAMRHSLAHITAAAVLRIWPDAKFGVGPVVENGYYYDIDLQGKKISEEDFPNIEKVMIEIIRDDAHFERFEMGVNQAIDWAKFNSQNYKHELLNDLRRSGTTSASDIDIKELGLESNESKVSTVSFYRVGDFVDLCKGPHVESTSEIGAFKLMKVAGAYWRGLSTNPQMQRLYGVAFETQKELDDYLVQIEQAKLRDHRKLGKDLELFTFSHLVGSGLPLFTPRGTILRELIAKYSNSLREQYGFEKVWTPHITKKNLYEKSGHWAKFGGELFLVTSQETSDEFALKPMNCPHHIQIYSSKPRSYKDLPIRYLETTTDYRDEKTGELGGLNRVRSLTQDDSHVFCRPDQIESEISNLLASAKQLYKTIDMKLHIRLSYRDDSSNYLGDKNLWVEAQNQLKKSVINNNIEYFEQNGEAAFYGPKIDFLATDAIGREHQVATIQLDFIQPQRFCLEFTDAKGLIATPVMIHCALLGSIERFLSVFIEHTAGRFPFWIAPEQIRVLTINSDMNQYLDQVTQVLNNVILMSPIKHNELRFSVDNRNESISKKIKDASRLRIPLLLIIGPKDRTSQQVSVKTYDNEYKVDLSSLAKFVSEYQ